jgi:hypothetical protein
MPMVVKIVGSTPTIRTINESEVVVSKHGKNKDVRKSGAIGTQNIYEAGRGVQTLRFAKELQPRSTVTGCSKGNITAEKCAYCRSRRDKAQSNRGPRYLTHLPVSFYKLNTIIDG